MRAQEQVLSEDDLPTSSSEDDFLQVSLTEPTSSSEDDLPYMANPMTCSSI
jgi:hypothetical protein